MHTDSIPPITSLDSPVWSNESDTLVHVVRHWATRQPTSTAYVYVTDGKEQHLTFGALHQRATAIAAALRARQEPGTTAIMLHPLGLDFVEAFFGCLYAGVVAVPLHPGRGKSANARLAGVVADCGPRTVLTTSALAPGLASFQREGESLHGLDLLATDVVAASSAGERPTEEPSSEERSAEERDPAALGASFEPSPEGLAFLQYTSGSTSQPKGTMVTHRNMMANQAMLRSVLHTDRSTVIVSWLPIFHDMGLIGNVLHAAYLGATAVLLSTLSFIKSPITWLRAIDRYKATVSGAPNFAYDLCVAKTTPSERAGLDLSSWRAAFNGAEPVRQRTIDEFARTFAPFGFQRSAFIPTYGLAEATLVVSGTGGAEPQYLHADARLLKEGVVAPTLNASSTQVLVSTGQWNHGDQHVVIVDPETGKPCADGQVGEIWVTGSHVAAGYWGNEAATRDTFGGSIPGDERRYLKTGDLGFTSASGLFITGRMKDLIIFRGQNIYPQDIELTVELAAPELRAGCTAAFSIESVSGAALTGGGSGTGVVVVAELEQREASSPELLTRIARRVQEQHELPLDRLVLVRRNMVPKTTSGKIQRRKCRDELGAGRLSIVDEWRNPTSLSPSDVHARAASHAASWIAQRQGVAPESVELGASIASYGLDSIQKVEFVHSLEQEFAISIPESSFFEFETIDDLLAAVVSCSKQAQPARSNLGAPPIPPNDRAAPRPGAAPVKLPAPARGAGGARPALPAMPAFSAMNWGVRGG